MVIQKTLTTFPQISDSNEKQFFSLTEAADLISNKLSTSSSGKIFHFPKNFFEFVRDIWSLSFEHPEWLKLWHVQLLCSDVQEALAAGKNYVAQLPRGHFKSTVLGYAYAVWYPCAILEDEDTELLYLSYTDGMSTYHIGKIKDAVNRNPILNKYMEDLAGTAISVFRFRVNGHIKKIVDGGVFKFKRGMHTNSGLVADDVLSDPANPLNLSQLEKVEAHFTAESMLIPNPGTPIIVFGTPMSPTDLLAKLAADTKTFNSRILPALNPIPGKRVLAEEIRSEEWLLDYKRQHPVEFQSEFALVPYLSTQSYLREEDVKKCMIPMQNFNPNRKYAKQKNEFVFAGIDIGKKRHPSHITIYSAMEVELGKIEVRQIFQEFLDGWEYTEQKDYFNMLAENFLIDVGYIDNTNSVLEERGLLNTWKLHTLTKSLNNNMAQIFESHVHSGNFYMIENERQLSQIVCVDINLNAPDTINGHGDSFFSNALALLAFKENYKNKTAIIGDMQDFVNQKNEYMLKQVNQKMSDINAEKICQKCGESGVFTESGKCLFCYGLLLTSIDDMKTPRIRI